MGAVVFGVDVGFRNTGVAVFEYNGEEWDLIDSLLIKTAKCDKKTKVRVANDDVRCVQQIASELGKLCKKHDPKLFVTELPHGGGKSSIAVKSMALASGFIATFTQVNRISGLWVTPANVKVALTGKTAASKLECIEGADKRYPAFRDKYYNVKRGAYYNYFEHVADAAGAFVSALDDQYIKLLENL